MFTHQCMFQKTLQRTSYKDELTAAKQPTVGCVVKMGQKESKNTDRHVDAAENKDLQCKQPGPSS